MEVNTPYLLGKKDLPKHLYQAFHKLLDTEKGTLLHDTTYRIPTGTGRLMNVDGNKMQTYTDITFKGGTHIEDVRRGMNKWLRGFNDRTNNDVWRELNFPELLEVF
jgi:hypothetical protein